MSGEPAAVASNGTRDRGRMNTALGSAIRQHRRATGLSQQDIADALGMSRRNYQRVEAGRVSIVVADLLVIARALRSSPWQLVQHAEDLLGFTTAHPARTQQRNRSRVTPPDVVQ